MRKIRTILKTGCILLVILSYFIFLNRNGRFNILYHDKEITLISQDRGFAYLADIGDSSIALGKLPVSILENDIEIRRDFSDSTDTVRNSGLGSFVIWENGIICFSSSDNSAPTQTGRVYRVIYPMIIGSRFARYCYAITAFFCFLLILCRMKVFIRLIWKLMIIVRKNAKILTLGFVTTLPFFFFSLRFLLHQLLWADEIYTLIHYCLDDSPFFSATIYDFPNNHVFQNLFVSIYLKVIHISSFCDIVSQTWVLRILFILFSALTIIFTALAAGKINKPTGVLAGIILTTTLPFYAWTTQIRGYSLSFLLISILLYILISYRSIPDRKYLISAAILSALLIYTIPFNAVFIAAIMLFTFYEIFGDFRRKIKDHLKKKEKLGFLLNHPQTKLLIAFLFGILLCVVFYFPVGDQIVSVYRPGSTYAPVTGTGILQNFVDNVFRKNFSEIWISFFAGRPLLAVVSFIGLIYLILFHKANHHLSYALRLSISVILIPFIICGITRYSPFNRNFLPLIPVCVLFISLIISSAANQIFSAKKTVPFYVLFFLYCGFSFGFNVIRIHSGLPNRDITQINTLSEPFFLSSKLDSDSFLTSVKEINQQDLPVVISWPADFYSYDLCGCYDLTCSCDYIGSEAQALIKSGASYFLIRTILDGYQNDPLTGTYLDQCETTPVLKNGAYLLYNCNAKSE
ncbi:MAG: glycosyltransferase family 39 protein [Flexilinea sp.]